MSAMTRKKVASGTLCEVYICSDKKGFIISAVKKYKATKGGICYAVLREINLLRGIQHPNIIKIQEIKFNAKLEIYLEYAGMTLSAYSDMLESYNSRKIVIKCISYQLIKGLSILHKNGIIHRDIKPDNIFISIRDYPHLKIGDFGLAKKMKSGTLSPSVCTLNYRPPEVLINVKKIYGLSLDIWSAACTLFEFLFYKELFLGNTDLEVIHDIFSKLCIKNAVIPTKDPNITIKCEPNTNNDTYLSKKFKKRIDMRDFKDMLENMLKYNHNERLSADTILECQFLTGNRSNYTFNEIKIEIVIFVRSDNINITYASRDLAIDHIIEAKANYKYIKKRTILCAIDIFDMFISICSLHTSDMFFVAYICLYIASKFYDVNPLSLDSLTVDKSHKQFLEYEKQILTTTNYRLSNINLLDIYTNIIKEKPHKRNDNYWKIICDIISNYTIIKNKEYDDMKKILLERL